MFIKAQYDGNDVLLNTNCILDIWDYDKFGLKAKAFTINRDVYHIEKAELGKLIKAEQTEPQTECQDCKYEWWNSEAKRYECSIEKCPYNAQTEPNSNADQRFQHVEYVEDDELKRCRECKHCVGEYRTPISASGRCYTYITCTANRCNYEQTEPQTDCHRRNIKTEDGERIYECIGCKQTDCAWK